MIFAKLFKDHKKGQILVIKGEPVGDNALSMKFICQPKNMGLSALTVVFNDDEEGRKSLDTAFDDVTQEIATSIVSSLFDADEKADNLV